MTTTQTTKEITFAGDFGYQHKVTVDVSTPEAAAKSLHAELRKIAADVYGHNPDIETFCSKPAETAKSLGGYGYWRTCWEAGPYDWAIGASFQLIGADWHTEPYYGFDLLFIPD